MTRSSPWPSTSRRTTATRSPRPRRPPVSAPRSPRAWAPSGVAHLLPHLRVGAPAAALTGLGAFPRLPGLLGLVAILAFGLLWLSRRRPPLRARSPGEAELIRVYDRLQRRLGRRRAPPQTPNEYRRAAAGGELDGLLEEVTEAVNRGVYSDRWPGPAEVAELRSRLS